MSLHLCFEFVGIERHNHGVSHSPVEVYLILRPTAFNHTLDISFVHGSLHDHVTIALLLNGWRHFRAEFVSETL